MGRRGFLGKLLAAIVPSAWFTWQIGEERWSIPSRWIRPRSPKAVLIDEQILAYLADKLRQARESGQPVSWSIAAGDLTWPGADGCVVGIPDGSVRFEVTIGSYPKAVLDELVRQGCPILGEKGPEAGTASPLVRHMTPQEVMKNECR